MNRVVVIGAGIGGLTTAALLAKAGLDVTVLEAHVYPGGCAGTFYHQGYRFDAGATLAAGFEPARRDDAPGRNARHHLAGRAREVAMAVHLPGGDTVTRWTDPARWRGERLAAFGSAAEPFWRWQEQTADRLWEVTDRGVPWPPQSASEAVKLAGAGHGSGRGAPLRLPTLALDAFRPLASHLRGAPEALRRYVDGQLLISAQVTSERANALYGAAALDMPRRGVAHVRGGIGSIAELLADAVRRHGGQVLYRQRVTQVNGRPTVQFIVETAEARQLRRRYSDLQPAAVGRRVAPGRGRAGAAPASAASRRTVGARSWPTSGWTERSSRRAHRSTTRCSSASRSAKATASSCR